MSLSVEFHRAALRDLAEAVAWYEQQRPTIGADFMAEIERCVKLAAEQPLLHPTIHKDLRRVPAKRFPYSVYYRAYPDKVIVVAVFHGSRNPIIWRRRT